eukprot:5618663-Pyramimonas_sp.AAC.1
MPHDVAHAVEHSRKAVELRLCGWTSGTVGLEQRHELASCDIDRSEEQPISAISKRRSSTVVRSSDSQSEKLREQRVGGLVAAPP